MKRQYGVIFLILWVLFCCAVTSVLAGNDYDEFRSCSICGMDRKAYGFSRILITYENGSRVGVCSLHCAVTEMNEHKVLVVKLLQAADRNTHALIEADTAFWVVGGSKRGVMTQNPKWAFATKDTAQRFIDSYGGTITTWERTVQEAREEAFPKKRHQ
jgi:hypothetical protein